LGSSIGFRHAALFLPHPKRTFSGAADCGTELSNHDAAWQELTNVCGDLVGSISRNLKQNNEWQMELLDASKKPVFRVRLVGETLK
jgi:hypothetical protein